MLSSLITNTKEIPKTLTSMDVTLKAILKVETDRDKKTDKAAREKAQKDRESEKHGNKVEDLLEKILGKTGLKDDKKKEVNFFEGLTKWAVDQLPGIFKKLAPALGSILRVAMSGAAAAAPIAVAGGLAIGVNEALKKAGDELTKKIGGEGTKANNGKIYNIADIGKAKDFAEGRAQGSGKSEKEIKEENKKYVDAAQAQRHYKSVNDKLFQNQEEIKSLKIKLDAAKKTKPGEVARLQKELEAVEKKKEENEINKTQAKKKAEEAVNRLDLNLLERFRKEREEYDKQNIFQRLVPKISDPFKEGLKEGEKNKPKNKPETSTITRSAKGTTLKKATGGVIHVPGSGDGDTYPQKLQAGSFVLNKKASEFYKNTYATGGYVNTLLEPGEMAFAPGKWHAGHVALNNAIPRFAKGGEVTTGETPKFATEGDKIMATLATTNKLRKMSGSNCTAAVIYTYEDNKLPVFPDGTTGDPNNPRGAASLFINKQGYKPLPGFGEPITLNSPLGKAESRQMDFKDYQSAVGAGKIPSGGLAFQTRHPDWNTETGGSLGFDTAIIRNGGKNHFRGDMSGTSVYGDTKKVMVITPAGVDVSKYAGTKGGGSGDANEGVAQSPLEMFTGAITGAFGGFGEMGAQLAGAFGQVASGIIEAGGARLLSLIFPGLGIGAAGATGMLGGDEGGNTPIGAITGQGMEKAKSIKAELIKQGYSPGAASGIVGNLYHESDGFKADTEYGGGGGRGWAQWTGTRRTEFEAYAKSKGISPTSDAANMGYLIKELNEGKHWGRTGGSTAELKKIQDPVKAARYFMDKWERPSVPHWDRRLSATQQISKLQSGGIVPGSGEGDRVPMMLQEGGFVMNKNAAKALTTGQVRLQSGGIASVPSSIDERFNQANQKYMSSGANSPTVVYVNNGGGGSREPSIAISAPAGGPIPNLGDPKIGDYGYRLAMGGVC